jgi:sialate O-acetylesterase
MKRTFFRACAVLFASAFPPLISQAEVRLPSIFGDHMVLQQGRILPVWGWADPGEVVTVRVSGQQGTTTTGPEGKWRVDLQALKGGREPVELIVSGKNTLTLQDVWVGDVWLCSGQSNMEWPLWDTTQGRAEVAQANHPGIRLFKVAHHPSLEPVEDCEGRWVVCAPESIGGFSAVAYYFGRDLHRNLGCPVGLIGAHWGGSLIQAWTSLEGLRSDPALEGCVRAFEEVVSNKAKYEEEYRVKTLPAWEAAYQKWLEEVRKPYEEAQRQWGGEVQKARKEGKPLPPAPVLARQMTGKPTCRSQSMNNPTVLFQGMIAPLVPYAIRGAIWYQGESNANTPSLYAQMLPALIADWRSHWGQGDFPFLFVQLPNLNTVTDWAAMREAQARALAVPKTGMVVTLDVGDPKDIHPRRKAEVGARLALAARRVAYDQELVSSGPTFERMQIEGERVRLSFQNVGGGLMAVPGGDGGVKGFVVAGNDGIFWPAEGRIENASVVVWSDAVKQPVAVRYGWASDPEVDLFNKEGLPAAPFRTDQWPLKR